MSAGRLWNPSEFRTAAPASPATVFTCGLCGLRFTHGDRVCAACPIGVGCDLVRCPRCGYQFPRGSRTVEWLRRLWRGRRG